MKMLVDWMFIISLVLFVSAMGLTVIHCVRNPPSEFEKAYMKDAKFRRNANILMGIDKKAE